jgi:hypothetical protein
MSVESIDAPPSRGMTKKEAGVVTAFCIRHRERSEAIHRYGGIMDCFVAEPVIGRAFARPVGSLAQTLCVCRRQ